MSKAKNKILSVHTPAPIIADISALGKNIAVLRTSDRGAFKRCRRRWGWQSALRQNLTTRDNPSYYWIGSGGHFALEDFYGYNRYQHPVEALHAYVAACKEQQRRHKYGLPDDWQDQATLCEGILENYLMWCTTRDPYETVWINNVPQVEVTCHIPLDVAPPPGFDRLVYQFTLDRLVKVEGEYWILDWKFYKSFSQGGLEFDQQMSAYIWAAQAVFPFEIAGGILHEFKKDLPSAPRILANGKISTAEHQSTTYGLYRDALIRLYGDVGRAPQTNVNCLNELAARETPDRDDFIRRSRTRRTPEQIRAEGTKILMEVEDMCNPNLPLYPNPTRDCSWDCNLQDICLMMDRDDDWEHQLQEATVQRTEENTEWRQYLKAP